MLARTLPVVLSATILVLGCGDAPDRADDPAVDRSAPSAAEPAGSTTDASPGITADVAIEDRDGATSIRVTLSGLEPEARYPVHVHEGGCSGEGRVSLPLGRVTGRTDGTGSVRMTVGTDRLPDPNFSVRVQDPSGSGVVCAEPDAEAP